MGISRRAALRVAGTGMVGIGAGCQDLERRVLGEASPQLVYLETRDWVEADRVLGLAMAAAFASCGSRTAEFRVSGRLDSADGQQYTEDGLMTITAPGWSYEVFYFEDALFDEGEDGEYAPTVRLDDGEWFTRNDITQPGCDVETDPAEIWGGEDVGTATPSRERNQSGR